MNFDGFDLDRKTRGVLNSLDAGGRIPHAVIIESRDSQAAQSLALLMSMYAVCGSGENRPCGKCPNCVKAKNKAHPDIFYPQAKNKSKTYDAEGMREIIKDAYVKPNDAAAKVYVFDKADTRLSTVSQNTFLKLFEEPPQNVYFILLCENAQRLLVTIRSRCMVIRLGGEAGVDENARAAAEKIAGGITAAHEYELLLALRALEDKELRDGIFTALKQIFRDALVMLSGGQVRSGSETAKKLAARFTKFKLIEMIELCDSSALQIKQNVNINLLTTRLCGEFRRISWQR